VTGTGSNYPLLQNIPYGRYQYTFKISDNAGNEQTLIQEFYVDSVAFRVSHHTVDIDAFLGIISSGIPEITLEVDTLGAAYNIYIQKSQALLESSGAEISDYNGIQGF